MDANNLGFYSKPLLGTKACWRDLNAAAAACKMQTAKKY